MSRRTKIVATLGPSTREPEVLRDLIEAGADVLRVNFSHGTEAEHAEAIALVRETSERLGREVGLLGDIPGPKLRLDEIEGGLVEIDPGSELTLTSDEVLGTRERLPVLWPGLANAVAKGDAVYLADGRIRLRVLDTSGDEVRCEAEEGGPVASHQGVNLPGSDVSLPAVSEEDLRWVDFAVAHGIDLLA